MQQPFGSEKAIEITLQNRSLLMMRFAADPDDVNLFLLGYWLVTDFGNDDTYFTLTPEKFTESYAIGQNLKNGFWDVARK